MAQCPACKQEIKARKGGACPHCGEELLIHDARYFRARDGAPPTTILKRFEERVSGQMARASGMPVNFHISKKTPAYRREMVVAERLFQLAEYDLDLTLQALDLLFTHKQFSWKTRASLMQCEMDFLVALPLAQAIREKQARENAQAQTAYDAVMGKEDIFS